MILSTGSSTFSILPEGEAHRKVAEKLSPPNYQYTTMTAPLSFACISRMNKSMWMYSQDLFILTRSINISAH